jgi:nicotinate-nucleotide adenylyltransferase
MRVGIFGGSFDPIHFGHLILAEYCRTGCALDRVLFVPTASAPHKSHQQHSDATHRIEMLKLAIAGHQAFEVSEVEIERGGLSYTVETLRQLNAHHGDWDMYLLLGADSLEDLPTWREPVEICKLASLVVVGRPGAALDIEGLRNKLPDAQPSEMNVTGIEMPPLGISSTEIRKRIADGQSIRFQTPRAVEMYIEAQNLYTKDEA